MPPVSIPDEAGSSSAGPSTSTSAFTSALPVNPTKAVRSEPAWPEQIQTKISQLEKELEEEEITKKGFWRKKLDLVEKLLTRQQAKDLTLLLQQEKEGSKEYMKKLEELLVPKEEIHEEPETKQGEMVPRHPPGEVQKRSKRKKRGRSL